MSIFALFRKQQTASAARDRLQVLLAHERSSAGSDLVSILREEILGVFRDLTVHLDYVSNYDTFYAQDSFGSVGYGDCHILAAASVDKGGAWDHR